MSILLAGLIAAASTTFATVTANIVTNRTSGVAPLAIHFDASATTSTATTRPFHDVDYQWNFGDAGSGVWSTNGASKNSATGPISGHVFETPGDYTVTLTVKDTTGATDIETVVINVTDPNTVFSGTNTICIRSNATGTFDGAPSGAQQLTSSSWSTIVNSLATGKRVLLRRGDSWTHDGTTKNLVFNGPGILGAFGTGARPVINLASAGTGVFRLGTASTPNQFTDFRFMDLEVDGNDADRVFAYSEGTMHNVTFLRIFMHDAAGFLSFSTSALDWNNKNGSPGHTVHTGVAIVDTDFERMVFDGNINGITLSKSLMLGNTMNDSTSGEHVLRIFFTQRLVFAHNELTNSAGGRHLIKLHSGPEAQTLVPEGEWQSKYIVISDNFFSTQLGEWLVALGPQNFSYAERVENVIIERNHMRSPGSSAQVGYMLWASEVTARNNTMVLTNSGTPGNAMFSIEKRALEPAPHDNRIYNNSAYSATSTNAYVQLVKISSVASNTTVRNNLLSAPNVSSKAVISGSGTNLVQSNNIETNTPGWVSSSPVDALDFDLTSGSVAVGAGTSVPVFTDYEGVPRPQNTTWDVGAFEFISGSSPTVTVTANDASAGEPSNNGQFTVTATPAPSSPITVNINTSGGTATSGVDYNAIASTVVVGTSGSATVNVTVIDNPAVESTETVVLNVASGSGYSVGSPSSATVNITDNETNSVPNITTTTLPNGTTGTAYSQTLAATGGNGTLVWSLASGSLPAGLSLSSGGVISGTPTTAATSNFTVRVADSDEVTGGTDEDTQALSITINSGGNSVPSITTATLPNGTVGTAYSQTLAATGGDGALVWTLDSGGLPAGLSLSSGGVISGTPTTAATSNFTVRVADSDGVTGPSDEDTQALSITINASSNLLVGHWQLDETSGTTAADASGNGNNGTITGAVPTTGQLNGARDFDGVDDVINTGSGGTLDNLPALTVAGWIKPDTLGENNYGRVVQKGNGTNGSAGFRLTMAGTNQLEFVVDYATTDLTRRSAANSITLGTWQHVAVTWTGSATATNAKIYVNGVEVGSYATTTSGAGARGDDNATNLWLGNNDLGSRSFDGALDDVRVYNYALSPTEIQALAATGSLSGSFTTSSAAANLATVGTSDWAHWPGYDHKATGGSQISNFSRIGANPTLSYNDDPRPLTWTGGTPTASSTNNTSGNYASGINNGFSITVPASTTTRTVTVYVGGWNSTGQLTAQLSDGSAADYVHSSAGGSGSYDRNYTITYRSASAGQTLTITWINTVSTGNVTISGVALE